MFTCRDGKDGELSSQASKMLYKLPEAVYIASYKKPLDQSDRWKLFVQLWNYTKTSYRNTSGSLGEWEMLWEDEPQASVSTAFSSSPAKLSRVFLQLNRNTQYM